MNAKESEKERIFKQLQSCLDNLGSYDINSLMPLLYVVLAVYEGHEINIVAETFSLNDEKIRIQPNVSKDKIESDILKNIRLSVNNRFLDRKTVEAISYFLKTCKGYIKEYFQDIIEYIINYYSPRAGKYSGMSNTPREISMLMSCLIAQLSPKGIYDPCAGLCSYALLPNLTDIPFFGQEINYLTNLIADLRLYASKMDLAEITCEDCTKNWEEADNLDCLTSELPFGVRLSDSVDESYRPKLLEDFVLYKFVQSPSLKKAVLMVSMSTCFRKENFDLRKTLCDKNWVESVIKLPAGILPYAGINTAILVLNKERVTKDVKFILADDCILNEDRKRVLDYQGVLDRFMGVDDKQSSIVHISETYEHNCSLDPSNYIQERIDIIPGQKIVKFSSLAMRERGTKHFDETRGRVLQPEHMCSSITEMHTRNIAIDEVELSRSTYTKIDSKVIIFNVRADKFFIKNDEQSLFISPNYNCFVVHQDKCLPEYLADCVVNAKQFRESALMGQGMPRIDWDNLLLPIFENLDSQNQIIQRIYRQEQNELKKKLEALQVLSGKSSDLIHNLGITFTRISAGINDLMYEYNNPTFVALNDNIQFALRQINSTGTDFKFVVPELVKVNIYETIDKYIDAWQNFGYRSFDVFQSCNVSEDTKVEIDVNLFYTVLDAIFINAHQHGFKKHETPENKMLVNIEGVIYNEEKYIRVTFANNGDPLPDNFTIHDYVARGVVGINSFQDGLGGNHIYEIIHKFNGLVSLESEKEWLTVSVLIPVYITSEKTEFKVYECECV